MIPRGYSQAAENGTGEKVPCRLVIRQSFPRASLLLWGEGPLIPPGSDGPRTLGLLGNLFADSRVEVLDQRVNVNAVG